MLGKKIKEIRDYEANTQRETAEVLKVNRSTYGGWECGKDIIPLKRLNDVANMYKLSLDYLAGLSEVPIKREKELQISDETIAKNIRLIRLSHNLSQKDFAKTIQTSQSSIHNYESGKTLITIMTAIELSKKYQIPLEEFIQKIK